jgi:hypothetical protein
MPAAGIQVAKPELVIKKTKSTAEMPILKKPKVLLAIRMQKIPKTIKACVCIRSYAQKGVPPKKQLCVHIQI